MLALTTTSFVGACVAIAACSSSSVPLVGHAVSSSSGSSESDSTVGGPSDAGESDGALNNPERYADATVAMYDGPPPNVDGGHLLCATPNGLPIQFNPMYSGFDGTHMYQIPTFVSGVDPGSVTWGSSDPSMVAFQPYVTGIMITTEKAGDVTIVATAVNDAGATVCGTAPLHITQYTVDEWNLGNARYNNHNPLNFDFDAALSAFKNCDASLPFDASGFDGNTAGFDGNVSGFDASDFDGNVTAIAACLGNPFDKPPAACTNCHGAVGNGKIFGMSLFTDVSHTPEQTGGFSDQDLIDVFVDGVVPSGGYFDTTIVSYEEWHDFHRWADINTTEAQNGMLAYLRSLTPKEQVGCNDLFKKTGPGCAGDAGK